jgi:hypothetical protein
MTLVELSDAMQRHIRFAPFSLVIPAKAGTHACIAHSNKASHGDCGKSMDPRLRGDDEKKMKASHFRTPFRPRIP